MGVGVGWGYGILSSLVKEEGFVFGDFFVEWVDGVWFLFFSKFGDCFCVL